MSHRLEFLVGGGHMRPPGGGRRAGRVRPRGAILLEVVFALTLFFSSALVIMAGLNSALRTAQRVQMEAQAADLAVTLLSEVQMGLVPLTNDGPNPYEDQDLPDWSWEVVVETYEEKNLELALPEFQKVEVIIRNDAAGYSYRLTELMTEELLSAPPEEEDEGFGGDMMQPGPEEPGGGMMDGGPGGGRGGGTR